MRVFVAFDVPDFVKDKMVELEREIEKVTRRIRLTPKENMHITIKFMGEQPWPVVNRIIEVLSLEASKREGFVISLDKAGVFSSIENPRVLWVGERNNTFFNDFSLEINKELEVFRKADNEPFCHLTIGRTKGISTEEMLSVLRICHDYVKNNDLSFTVDGFYLYESKLYKKGAVYSKIEKFTFKKESS